MKMLCSTIFILILLGVFQKATLQYSDGMTHFLDRMERLIQKKCAVNADEPTSVKAVNALYLFKHRWQISIHDKTAVGDALYHFCMNESEIFISHLGKFVEEISPCLASEEKYLQEFIIDGYGKHNHYFCKALSVASMDHVPTRNCNEKFNKQPKLRPLIACYKYSNVFGDNSTVDTITKAIFCSDLSEIQACYEKILNEHCPDAKEIRDLKLIFLKQALEVCAKDTPIM